MNCKECIYHFMDKHPEKALLIMSLPMIALLLLHTTNISHIVIFFTGGALYLILTLTFAGWLAGRHTGEAITFNEAFVMAIAGRWEELSKERVISTHVAIATSLSLYASFMLGIIPDVGIMPARDAAPLALCLAVFYIYITERSRIYLGRHTEQQTGMGMWLGMMLTSPILLILLMGVGV